MTRKYEKVNPDRDSSYYIFDVNFMISVNQLDITSIDYINQLGFIDSGDSGINKEVANERITTKANIATMVQYHKTGVSFHVVDKSDTLVIHEYIQNHLSKFAAKMTGHQRLNRRNYPIDDLLALEELADKIYGHSKFLETGVDETGYFERMFSDVGVGGFFNFTEPGEEQTPDEKERESFADVFKQKQQTLNGHGNR